MFATTTVLGRSASVDFKATGKTVLKEGWKAIYSKMVKDEDETDEKEDVNENKTLPQFFKGEHDVCFWDNPLVSVTNGWRPRD